MARKLDGASDVAPPTPFVGRREEMRQLLTALEASLSGRGGVVLLAGEPGIGKTRTLQELADHARGMGARALGGRCHEGDGAPPYWPWIQILRAHGASDVAQAIPRAGARLPGSFAVAAESAQARFRLFDDLTGFFKKSARSRPLILLLDDLQCADGASLMLLQFLARESAEAPLLIVGAHRDTEICEAPIVEATLAELARQPHARRLQLRGLGEEDVAQLIERLTCGSPARALVTRIHEETAGNPFFVTEIVRLLDAAPGRFPDAAGSRGVQAIIAARLGRLSAECTHVVTVAAVLGREFDVKALLRASDLGAERVLAALAEAARAYLVSEESSDLGRARFIHALVREAIYRMLDAPRRIALHRRVGRALEEIHGGHPEPHLAELAYHFFQAAPAGDAERAVGYAERAARRALESLAFEEAAAHYTRALRALDLAGPADAGRRGELLLALGGAQLAAGEAERAKEAFDRAAELARGASAPELLARAALGAAARSDPLRLDVHLIGVLEEALGALDGSDSALRARLLARLARALGPGERAASLAVEAADMARRLGDPVILTSVLIDKRFVLWGPDDLATRLAEATEILRSAEGSRLGEAALAAHMYRVIDLLELGRIVEVDRELKVLAARAHTLRQPWYRQHVAALGAMRARLDGRYEDADRLAKEALELGLRVHDPSAPTTYAGHVTELGTQRGPLRDLEQMEADFKRFSRDHPNLGLVGHVLPWLYSELGREADARRELDRLAAHDFADIPRDMNWLGALVLLSEASAFVGDAPRAARLYDLLRPYADRVVVAGFGALCFGSASLYLGRLAATLARWEDAERHLSDALTLNRRLGARPFVAHTRHAHAAMLLARRSPGDMERATELLDGALGDARSLGMTRLAERISSVRTVRRPAIATATASGATGNLFRWEGDYWTILYEGAVLRLRDTRGLHYLAQLLGNPGRELLAADLVSGSRRGRRAASRSWPSPGFSEEVRRKSNGSGDVADARAVAAYRQRLGELRDALTEARAFNDLGRSQQVQAEIDFLVRQLTQAVGLGGRRRGSGSYLERARVNVRKGIRAALRNVAETHAALGQHLAATVRTGTLCSYKPDPRVAVPWTVLVGS